MIELLPNGRASAVRWVYMLFLSMLCCTMLCAQTAQTGIETTAINVSIATKVIPVTPSPSTSATKAKSDEAAQLFTRRCAGCHTIGNGASIGPDLQNVRSFAKADIAASIRRMQVRTGPLTDHEVEVLTALLQDPAAGKRLQASTQRTPETQQQEAVTLSPPSATRGQALFEGRQALRHGGPACNACHSFHGAGGSIAVDLSDSAARLGKTGLMSGIQQANFRIMNAAYRNHKITPQDAADLAEFLSTDNQILTQPWTSRIPQIGLLGAVLLFLGTTVLYRRRITGARARLQRR